MRKNVPEILDFDFFELFFTCILIYISYDNKSKKSGATEVQGVSAEKAEPKSIIVANREHCLLCSF